MANRGRNSGNNNGNSPRGSRTPRPAPRRAKRGFFGTLGYWAAVLGLWLAVAGVGIFIWVAYDLPDPEELWKKTDRPAITYVDINGTIIERRGAADAPPVDLKSMPKYVPEAVMAIEDRKFYNHFGVDVFGLTRAVVLNLKAGHVVAGGSTITQQLAKNLFLSSDQNIKRKAQELLLALWLESRFSKDEILSLYLARVYFGSGAYGLEEAAERYFNKTPANLTISEAAMLAGMLKAPSRYNPVSSTKRAAERATVVLDVMEKQNVITHAQRLEAVKTPLKFVQNAKGSNIGYFLDWIEPDVGAIVDEPKEDIIVETTLDVRHQAFAEAAIAKEFAANGKNLKMSQTALIALAGDGGVRAMVGGRSYNESEFNRVIEAKRQPGSSFKPFVYLAALEHGIAPNAYREDKPFKIGNWAPQNYDGRYRGPMTISNAFAQSINTVAVQLSEEVGRDAVVRVARRLGIRSRLDPEPTIALGTEVLTPIELTSAYVPFSNGGAGVTPFGIKRIRLRSGKILWERQAGQPRRVIDETILRNMNSMLRLVVTNGSAKAANLPDRIVGGKTGTTSDYRDAWFVGFTAGYTTGVWVGNDDFGIKMNRVTGGTAPARIWRDFMINAQAGTPSRSFLMPVAPTIPEAGIVFEAPANEVTNLETIDSPEIIDNGGVATVNSDAVTKDSKPNAAPEAAAVEKPAAENKSLDQIIKEVQTNKTN